MERDSKSKPYNKSRGFFLASSQGPRSSDGIDFVICLFLAAEPYWDASAMSSLREKFVLPKNLRPGQVSPLGIAGMCFDTLSFPAALLS